MISNRIVGQLSRRGVGLARQPLIVTAYAVGIVKGTAESLVRTVGNVAGGVAGSIVHPPQRSATAIRRYDVPTEGDDPAPGGEAPTSESPTGERTRFGGLNTEPAPPMSPGGGGEAVQHEPTVESRDVAHGDAPAQQREVESWAEETDEAQVEPEPGLTQPLLDPATAKAVRSEAETLRRAADPDKS